jgi:uncharacterized Zn finger protein
MKCTKCSSEDIENIDGFHFKCRKCGHFFDRVELELNEAQDEWAK